MRAPAAFVVVFSAACGRTELGVERDQSGLVCGTGVVLCGGSCVSARDVRHCGRSCEICGAPAFAVPTCDGVECDFTCGEGFHRCPQSAADGSVEDVCIADDAPDACGPSCVACPRDAHGRTTCRAGRCELACAAGYHRCADASGAGARCASDRDPASCGARCEPCAAPDHAVPTCSAGGACGWACASGFHECAGACAPDGDPASCGLRCEPCPAPPGAEATCVLRSCGWQCTPGYHRCPGSPPGGEDACRPDGSPASCGARCDPCPAPPGGAATCEEGRCGMTCALGEHLCAGVCVDDDDPSSCGLRCDPCPAPTHAAATCSTSGACGWECQPGFHRCAAAGGELCLSDVAPASCGTRCGPCPVPANAEATCAGGACGFKCLAGFHLCGDACVSDLSPNHCGTRCLPCAAPADAAAWCRAGQCGFDCPAGEHRCGNACVRDDDPRSCGSACTPCPAPPDGAAACVSGQCGFTCATGFHACGGACVSNLDPLTCGTRCTACAVPAHGRSTCDGTSCGIGCDAGYHACGGACASDDDPQTCGARCSPCPAPSNAFATCVLSACDFACFNGWHRCPGTSGTGDACVTNTSTESCGTRCAACAPPPGATPTCDGSACGFLCPTGQHACGNACALNDDVASCGARCSPCTVPANGTSTCDGVSCGIACNPGYHACGPLCVSNAATGSCGTRCAPCPVPANGFSTCDGTACGFACNSGYHACGTGCAANTSPQSCGSSCTACPAPANAIATCDGVACGFACRSGYRKTADGTACEACDTAAACGTDCLACGGVAHATAYTCAGNSASASVMCRVSCEPGWRPTPAGTACEACDDLNSCGLECAACPPDPPGAAYGCTSNTVAAAQACALACDAGFVKVGAACLSNGWVPWSLGTSAHLSAVAFADALSGLIAGNGVLFRTADGGKGWTGSSVSALVPALAYPAPAAAFLSTGAASGGARVLRSVNGGATWSASLSGTGFAITHLAFASASVGWAAGATSGVPPAPVLYATANGGASWTPLAAPSANVPLALHRVIARGVWGDAGGIYASDNGGTSWTGPALLQGPGGTVREPRGLSMHDGLLGWATTHCSTHKTIDGAASFSGEDLLCEAIDFAALAFPTADDGWIVGGQDEQSVSAGVIFVTGDAGGCWEPQVGNVAQNHLRAVHMIDAVRGWSVGDSGTVLYTNSGGDCIGAGCARQCP